MNIKCKDCASFVATQSGMGECHNNPPEAFLVMTQNPLGQTQPAIFSGFPTLSEDSFCNRFEPKMKLDS